MDIPCEEFLDFFCRTCNQQLVQTPSYTVNTTPAHQYHSIFNTIEEISPLLIAELIASTIPQIEVELNDELSKKICHKCFEQLQSIHRFQQMCIQTDHQMRQLIDNFNMVINKDLLVQESHSDAGKEQTIEFAPVNTLLEAPQLNDGDLPQSSDKVNVENCSNLEVDDSVCARNEPCDDNEPNVVQSDSRWSPSAVIIQNEMMTVNAEEELSLPSYIICKDKLLQQHKLHAAKEDREQLYKCPKSNKSYKTAESLKRHYVCHDTMNAPTPIQSIECPHCPKKYTSKGNLDKHITSHTKNKRYKCDYCDKCFANVNGYRRHTRTHAGEKLYKCKYCKRDFPASYYLFTHLRVHLGENVYRCEMCPSSFRLRSEERIHFATHKNEDEETRERNMRALKEEENKLRLKFGIVDTDTEESEV